MSKTLSETHDFTLQNLLNTEIAGENLAPIGFAAPKQQYLAHKDEIDQAIARALMGDLYIIGRETEQFEQEFADFCGVTYAIGVANGTDALHLALRALGIGAGDEVITTAMTAVATVSAIEMSGAKAVFADIRPEHGGLDPLSVASVITPRTRAIIAVHLYGHPVDMTALLELANKHNIAVIEDCAQAHGAAIEQTANPDNKTAKPVAKKVGSFGVMGCFSFYPTKNLGAIGDGGAVVTNDAKLAEKLRGLRQYGWVGRQISEFAGYNSRLDELQSAILRVKLRYLSRDNAQRKRIAETYLHGLSTIPELRLPWPAEHTHPAWHLFVIQCASAHGGGESSLELRQKLKDHMAAQGINCGIHYPMPIYLQPAYRPRYPNVTLTMTEEWSRRILSLPIYPELPMASVERVIRAVKEFFAATCRRD